MVGTHRRSTSRRLLLVAALDLAALSLTLCLAEVGLRRTGRFEPAPRLYVGDRESGPIDPELGVLDPELGWRLAPRQVIASRHPDHGGLVYRANAQGFRSERDFERDAAPSPGEVRLAFVGDSFTFGVGVEEAETFARRVAAALPGARAINLGQAGFGVDQMERALALWALPLAPRLVVVTFVDDDLRRSLSAYRRRGGWVQKPTYVLDRGRLRRAVASDRPGALRRWLEQDSRLVEAWRRVEARLARRLGLGPCWRLNRALFARMAAACAAEGVPLVVVRIPDRDTLRRAPAFRRDLEALGIAVLDLAEEVPDDPRRLYFPRDPHLAAEGHRWVAERLLAFLSERDLLGPADAAAGYSPAGSIDAGLR